MVDSQPYAAQERELQKRLPNVSPQVIKHFLTEHRGNVEECYQKLRVLTPQPLSPDMNPFLYNLGGRTSTVSTSHPSQYHQPPPLHPHPPPLGYRARPLDYQRQPLTPGPRPPHDHRMIRRQLTWDSYSSQTLPNPRRVHTQVQQPPLDPHQLMYTGASPQDYQWGQYMASPAHEASTPPWTLPRRRERAHSNAVVYGSNIYEAQHQQIEALHRHHESQVEQLAFMKQTVENRKHQLSRLRVEVSAIPSEQQIAELKEVIQTLEIDLRDARNDMHVQEMQSKMKAEQDLYTDEGVRWYCSDCSFLNHPLMTLCEKCDIPRPRQKT